jgi:hypothetical protein
MVLDGEADEIIIGQPGEPISTLAALAISVAKLRGCSVTMRVGEDTIIVTGDDTAGGVAAAYAQRRIRDALARRQRQQDFAQHAASKAEVALMQVRLCNHLAGMKQALEGGMRSTVMWIAKLGRLASDERLTVPFNAIAKALLARGYQPDTRAERPTAAYRSDTDTIALYVIGHALDRMIKGKRPHPVLAMMAERYEVVRARRTLH